MSDNNKRLYYLKELDDYRVASGYHDVRGWDVTDSKDKIIGKVDGLISNKNTERVVYLDVEVNKELIEAGHKPYQQPVSEGPHEILNKEGENHLIIPVGMVDLDEDNEKVISNIVDYESFSNAKRFKEGEEITSEYEITLLKHYTGDETIVVKDVTDEFYDRPEFNTTTRRTGD
ncbi:MAG: PRC-barrel domain-containing protein [Bacteroidales bacterium]